MGIVKPVPPLLLMVYLTRNEQAGDMPDELVDLVRRGDESPGSETKPDKSGWLGKDI
jgi:hypothetical protein